MSRKRRELSEEEMTLWRFVTRHVTPHSGFPNVPAARHPQPEARAESPPPDRPAAPAPRLTPVAPRVQSRPAPRPLALGASDGIDRRTAQRFARGDMTIDGRLDLHGLTVAQAQSAVSSFIRRSAAAGHRCVILVTGKGRPSAEAESRGETRGRIRAEALHWLGDSALRPLILTVREARPQHGGAGALYVLLKRQR